MLGPNDNINPNNRWVLHGAQRFFYAAFHDGSGGRSPFHGMYNWPMGLGTPNRQTPVKRRLWAIWTHATAQPNEPRPATFGSLSLALDSRPQRGRALRAGLGASTITHCPARLKPTTSPQFKLGWKPWQGALHLRKQRSAEIARRKPWQAKPVPLCCKLQRSGQRQAVATELSRLGNLGIDN